MAYFYCYGVKSIIPLLKDFPDFDYKYDNHKKSHSAALSSSSNRANLVLDENIVKPTRKNTHSIHTQKSRRNNNLLNGVPLGTHVEEFDVVGQVDLFKHNGGILDDRLVLFLSLSYKNYHCDP